jgi:hypothetical protein
MKSPDVTIDVCLALLQESLAGFRYFPATAAGERRFAFALQENCVSVGHVRAVLESFDESFPTVKEIHDAAWNLRAQFEPQEDSLAELRRKYGNPEAFNVPADELSVHWRAFRDALYYTEGPGIAKDRSFWEAALARDLDPKWNHKASIDWVRDYCRTVGWEAARKQETAPTGMPYKSPIEKRRVKSFAAVGAPITQADIDRASERRKTTAEVDRDLDSWSDPDR